ncbi:MAG TPA: MBL fold metallo-hydrolase [Bacillota bacterium]|nr:MBL fold metallo-hydrolase [Bacillota bacterium]
MMKHILHDDMTILKLAINPFLRMLNIHLYYIDGLLIDTGPSIRRRTLAPVFQSLDIKQVAITHHHEDHAGMAPWIVHHLAATIYCHENKLSDLEEKARLPWYRTLFSGSRRPFRAKPFPDVIRTPNHIFYPIKTPGHTPDHVCLLEPEKGWLFTGDLYITPYPKVFMKEESMSAYIDSLRNLRMYDYDTVFCAHEGMVVNGKAKMEQKLAYLEQTRLEVIRLHQLGYSDQAIMEKLFPEKVKLETASFGSFSRLNLIRSCYRE